MICDVKCSDCDVKCSDCDVKCSDVSALFCDVNCSDCVVSLGRGVGLPNNTSMGFPNIRS